MAESALRLAEPDPATRSEDDGLALPLAALAATALAMASHDAGGVYSDAAIGWLSVSLAAALAALVASIAIPSWRAGKALAGAVLLACMAAQAAALIWKPIEVPMQGMQDSWQYVVILLSVSAVLAGSLCADRSWWGRWAFPTLVVIGGGLLWLFIHGLPVPGVDAFMFQRMSCDTFLAGGNPYAMRFPDPYPPASSAQFYGPGISVGGVLQIGYPYMPLSLLLALPGHLLGDIRYANLVYFLASVVLIARARRHWAAQPAALLLLFSPIAPLALYMGWNDVQVVFMVALTGFCAARARWLLPYVFGLLLVSKQYMLAMAPLCVLFLPRPWRWKDVWAFGWRAAVPAAAITLPFVLWNPGEFFNGVVMFQVRQPFRPDALSYLNALPLADPAAWTWLPFVVIALMILVCLVLARRRGVSFPLAVAVCFLPFFALSKQAFANYYFVVIGAACAAVAASQPLPEAPEPRAGASSGWSHDAAPEGAGSGAASGGGGRRRSKGRR